MKHKLSVLLCEKRKHFKTNFKWQMQHLLDSFKRLKNIIYHQLFSFRCQIYFSKRWLKDTDENQSNKMAAAKLTCTDSLFNQLLN